MVHQDKLNGYCIVLDTSSGSVHAVDPVAYDIIALYKTNCLLYTSSLMLWNSISAVLTAFVFLAIGFLITRAGWITKDNKNLLTMLGRYIAVPCTIFKNVLDTVSPDNISSCLLYTSRCV